MAFDAFETYAGLEGKPLIEALLRDFPGKLALVSSFGAESVVLLHMAAQIDPTLPVIFLDTGRHFPETLDYRDQLVDRLRLRRHPHRLPGCLAAARAMIGTGACSPTTPTSAARSARPCRSSRGAGGLRGLDHRPQALPGRRLRGRWRPSSCESGTGRFKLNPLADLGRGPDRDLPRAHSLPAHPLLAQGYRSIGCASCTRPTAPDAPARAGRWFGIDKTECGIHWTHNGRPIRVAAGR